MAEADDLLRELMAEITDAGDVHALAALMADNEAVMAAISEALEDTTNESTAAFYNAMKNALSGDLNPVAYEKALAMAADEAREAAGTLAKNLTKTELRTIAETIADGLNEGLDPKAIARRLDEVKGLDSNRAAQFRNKRKELEAAGLSPDKVEKELAKFHDELLRDRKQTIAQTEGRYATEHARRIEAESMGARFKVWITAGDDRVSDECESNESAGPIPINEAFPGGATEAPQHPGCRCTIAYATSDAQVARMQAHADARAERTAAAKEDAA